VTTAASLLLAVHPLATTNAALNATATVLLLIGYVLIRRGQERRHKQVMYAAFGVSAVFLVSYLYYHYQVGHVSFSGPSSARRIYIPLLISHIVLAVTVPPLAIATIVLGILDKRVMHRRLARWTFPIWLYVSVTGVVVYVMLYHLYPSVPDGSIISP
jgi:putative membrane protein